LTSKSSADAILQEVLGLNKTSCEAFKLLSIDNSIFFQEAITREVVYLTGICYLIEHSDDASNNFIVNCEMINKWIKSVLNTNNIKVDAGYIKEIKLEGDFCYFTKAPYGDFPKIKMYKFRSKKNCAEFSYTNKPSKLGIKEIFHNHIYTDYGRCLGATKLWLENMSLAYKLDKHHRVLAKNNAVQGLEVIDNALKDKGVGYKIELYRKDLFGYINLSHLRDCYSLNVDLPVALANIAQNMLIDNLNQLYIQVLTTSHALGLSIILKGNYFKFIFYDPDDPLLYKRIYIYTGDANVFHYRIGQIIDNDFKYLTELISSSVLLKLYVPLTTSSYKENKIPIMHPIIDNFNEITVKEFLILGISNHDYNFIAKLLNNHKINLNFYFSNHVYTPLIWAINYDEIDIVRLLLTHGADVNFISKDGRTPLYVALYLFHLKIINLLLEHKAIIDDKIKLDHEQSNRLKFAGFGKL